MTGFDYFSKALYSYADFEGRASRSEYWFFVLFQVLFLIGFALLGVITSSFAIGASLAGLFYLATIIPRIAVAARRLHDMGQTAWFLLLAIVPGGSLALIVLYCLDSQPHTNKWGPNPNYVDDGYDDEWFDDDEVLDDYRTKRPVNRRRDDDYV